MVCCVDIRFNVISERDLSAALPQVTCMLTDLQCKHSQVSQDPKTFQGKGKTKVGVAMIQLKPLHGIKPHKEKRLFPLTFNPSN